MILVSFDHQVGDDFLAEFAGNLFQISGEARREFEGQLYAFFVVFVAVCLPIAV